MNTKSFRCLLLVAVALSLVAGGCGKKSSPLPVPTAGRTPGEARDTGAPVVTLTVSPASIRAGESVTLSWEARNANALRIDHGVGTVELAGSRVLTPQESTAYTATATGPGGSATATSHVTVTGAAMAAPAGTSGPGASDLSIEDLFERNIKDIFFEYDKFELSPEAIDVLYANANFLRLRPDIAVIIEGHCDERGTAEYNLALGDRRAKVTKDFLVGIGIEPERITTISYGEERPFDPGQGEDSWIRNRRAHFVLGRP